MTSTHIGPGGGSLPQTVFAGVLTVPFLLRDRISRWLRRR